MRTTSQCNALVAEVAVTLQRTADPARIAAMEAYMRGQFAFLGVSTPRRRTATAPLLRAFRPQRAQDLLAAAQVFWRQQEREFQYVGIDLLVRYRQMLGPEELPSLLALVCRKSWWDSVDSLAGVVGGIVRRYREAGQAAMDAAVSADDFWLRRVAMLHQLGWRADTDVKRLFGYAERLGAEKEFFIQKAVGWALRDYARHDAEAVGAFLRRAGGRLSALSVREAARWLAEPHTTRGKASLPAK